MIQEFARGANEARNVVVATAGKFHGGAVGKKRHATHTVGRVILISRGMKREDVGL